MERLNEKPKFIDGLKQPQGQKHLSARQKMLLLKRVNSLIEEITEDLHI